MASSMEDMYSDISLEKVKSCDMLFHCFKLLYFWWN